MRSLLALAVGLSFACAGTTAASSSSTAPVSQGGTCSQATLARGTIVYSRPDGASDPVLRLNDKTQMCVDADQVGFGFHHVKMGNGQEGYVADSDLG